MFKALIPLWLANNGFICFTWLGGGKLESFIFEHLVSEQWRWCIIAKASVWLTTIMHLIHHPSRISLRLFPIWIVLSSYRSSDVLSRIFILIMYGHFVFEKHDFVNDKSRLVGPLNSLGVEYYRLFNDNIQFMSFTFEYPVPVNHGSQLFN